MANIKKEYERWLANATADTDVAAELKTLDDAKIEDAFYRNLAFGTGGLRGVIGAGTNRMNVYTVAKASQGLADYLKKNFETPSVAIGYDSRIFAFKLGYLLDKAHSMIDFEDYRDLFNKYETMTKISFDYAVVEKESSIQVLRYSGNWKDVGTWNMMAEVMADKTKGKAVLDETCENTNVVNALADKVVYTGPIDAYFDYKLGALEYRSVRFEMETLDKPNFQGNAAVNYTDRETPWTRIIEHKWFEFGKDENGNELPKTIISREYSSEWKPGDEPYYPVNDAKNARHLSAAVFLLYKTSL